MMANSSSLKKALGISIVGVCFGFSTQASASGFQNYDWSASSLGNAHAGTAASCHDAATAWTNPAGMSCIDNGQLLVSGTVVHGDFDFDFTRSTGQLGLDTAVVADIGDLNDDPAETALVPALHYVRPMPEISDRLTFGMSVSVPFGLTTDYDTDSAQRYLATRSEVLTLDFNPSLAFEVTDSVTIGGGFSVQYVRAKLEKRVNVAAVCAGIEAAGTIPAGTCTALGFPAAGSNQLIYDFNSKLTADDWSYGWNVGALWEITDSTRIGVHHRSFMPHNLEGRASFDGDALDNFNTITAGTPGINTALGTAAGFVDQDGRASLNLPEISVASFFHTFDNIVDIMFDVAYTRWNRFDEIRVITDLRGLSVTRQEYKDTWRFSGGANYHIDDNWTVRAGYMYDQSPIRNAFRTARLPGSDRHWVTGGVQYRTDNDKLRVDLSYGYVFFDDDIDVVEADPDSLATLVGDYSGGAHLIAANLVWNFD